MIVPEWLTAVICVIVGALLTFIATLIVNRVSYKNEYYKIIIEKRIQAYKNVEHLINKASRPVILIGDGINQTHTAASFGQFANKVGIPVLSSRYGHDVIGEFPLYFGYIGSFGLRYSNFILSKADLIISLGNRLNFPINSESYKNIPYQAKIVRFEVDKEEFSRDIPNAINYHLDLEDLLPALAAYDGHYGNHIQWLDTCNEIKDKLWDSDVNEVITTVDAVLSSANKRYAAIINDVGDNEFWISRSCAHSICGIKVLYSKSFASLGSALPKSIGAYYSTRRPIVCFTGDQGFQMNLQELQAIAHDSIPVLIVVMNNYASGMIRDKEKKSYGTYLHSTLDSGYSMPDLSKIADAYGLAFYDSNNLDIEEIRNMSASILGPTILNLRINPELGLAPFLPIGRATQDMEPRLEQSKYDYINNL